MTKMSLLSKYLDAKKRYEDVKQRAKSEKGINSEVDQAYNDYINAKIELTNAGWAPM